MSIWFRPFTLEEIQRYSRGSMTEHLDLRFTEIGPDYLAGKDQPERRRRHLVAQLEKLGYNVELAPVA